MPIEQTMKTYNNEDAFRSDFKGMARQGWEVVSQTQVDQRPGCMRILLTGGLAMVFPPKPHVVVTFKREKG